MQSSFRRGNRVSSRAFTLLELLVVIGLMAFLISVLLPALSHQRSKAIQQKVQEGERFAQSGQVDISADAPEKPLAGMLAEISSFDAAVNLTPKLSVGTAQPESIYEATFTAKLLAQRNRQHPSDVAESEIELPLPPQIISLGNLTVAVNDQLSDAFTVRGDKLIWHGPLVSEAPTPVAVTFSAIGKGVYALQTPPGRILDQFKIEMTAHGSDVRMLELSLQPTSLERTADTTKYTWDYKRLMFGRPIALDVLGIAPIDRLGELSWLGPLSVIAFGLVLGLIGRAFPVANFDKWMLLLVLGLFTGSYPLMYFSQEFITLRLATILIGTVILGLIAVRAVTLMGTRIGMLGVTVPAGLIMTLAITAATRPNLQGLLLTVLALGLFALGMLLAPKLGHDMPGSAAVPAM